MKFVNYSLFFLLVFTIACNEVNQKVYNRLDNDTAKGDSQLSLLLDNNKLSGTILIYDAHKEQYYSNNLEMAKARQLPASTFKIPNSIIGLETGMLESANTVFKWDGSKRSFPIWEKDLTLKQAFQVSCVPCFQELAIKIGSDTMRNYLDKLSYPGMEFNQENLNMFWLQGESKISPMEQIDFLQRLYNSELKISPTTTDVLKDIMEIEQNKDYSLSGKTGWGIIDDKNVGWFVGYLEKGKEIYYFASCIQPEADFNMDGFIQIRKEITIEAFKELKII